MLDGGTLEPKDAYDPLTKSVKHKQVSILWRKTPPPDALKKAHGLYKTIFGKLGREDADGLVNEYRQNLGTWQNQLTGYKALADLGKYPGKNLIDHALTKIAKQLAIRDSYEFIEALIKVPNDWRDLSEDMHDLSGFYTTQKPTWDKLIDATERFKPNLTDLCQDQAVANAIADLDKIRTHATPYGQINQIDRLIQLIEARNTQLITEKRTAALTRIEQKIAEVVAVLNQAKADDSLRNAALSPLQKLKLSIEDHSSIPQIAYDLERANKLLEASLELIDTETRKKVTQVGGKTGQTGTKGIEETDKTYKSTRIIKAADVASKPYLESEGDVENYIAQLREELLEVIKSGQKARIQ